MRLIMDEREELERKLAKAREDLAKVHEKAVSLALKTLSLMPEECRRKVFDKFCRSCCVPIEGKDWSKQNYCCECSPDPKDYD